MRLCRLGHFNKLPHRLGGEIAAGDDGDGCERRVHFTCQESCRGNDACRLAQNLGAIEKGAKRIGYIRFPDQNDVVEIVTCPP